MNSGRTVFSQLIEFLPHQEFQKCVARYGGGRYLKNLSCWDQYLAMTLADLTYRESLRDIEACLRSAVSSSTWDSVARWHARRWPMRTNRAPGESTLTLRDTILFVWAEVTMRKSGWICAYFEVSWRHAEEDILADLRRVGTGCGFHVAVLVGGGCNISDSRAFLVDCVPVGLVLELTSEAWEARNKTLKTLELAALSRFEIALKWKMDGK